MKILVMLKPIVKLFKEGYKIKLLTLVDAGGVQNDPLVRRLAAISHRIMLWSQKFLTLSIKVSPRR